MTVPNVSEEDIVRLVTERNASITDTSRHWRFDESRSHVIQSWADVQACPGSGKTTLVAAKLLVLAKKWGEPTRGVCALTHTNVARDEIIGKLQDHPAGFKLTAYPHFIGTIQEFVNRFLGLPYVRTCYEFKRLIEEDEGRLEVRRARIDGHTIQQICHNLYRECDRATYEAIKDYLGSLHFLNADGDLRFFKQHNAPQHSPATSDSDRRRMLLALKEAICAAGIFHFRDMYAFADKLIAENVDLISALRTRFPVVLIDEMQDTQRFQDTLLWRIFDGSNVRFQRLGDPDQAIFEGIGGEEPNETYNAVDGLYEVKSSFRFGTDIAKKVIGLSYNALDEIASALEPPRREGQHTIFLYEDATCERVLEAFADLVARSDPNNSWMAVKAVGGLDGDNGEIRKYWAQFDKTNSAVAPRPQKLIHIAHRCAGTRSGPGVANYELLLRGVVDLLRKCDVRRLNSQGQEVYHSPLTLIQSLRDNGKYEEFRKRLTLWTMNSFKNSEEWIAQVDALKQIIGIDAVNDDGLRFLQFDTATQDDNANQQAQGNTYTAQNGRKIAVGTIHSVKGETHDATLILETKFNRWFDCAEMLPYMLDPAKDRPVYTANSRKKDSTLAQYMRKLYVAGTRPRHLLCMALLRSHISAEQTDQLQALGWTISDVSADD